MTPIRLHHVAVWVEDLDRMREFYVAALGGTSGPLYENLRTGFRSYFISFRGGRLELMWQPGLVRTANAGQGSGFAHLALSVGSRAGVDQRVATLRTRGVRVVGEPRVTGDGYYEAVIEDPEGNRIELIA